MTAVFNISGYYNANMFQVLIGVVILMVCVILSLSLIHISMLPHMMEVAGVTEELKACDPMRWVGLMNTLTAQIEEILIRELICS